MADPSILFVCLGNICRSPMAEGVMRDAAAKAGIAIRLDSAGTSDWEAGDPPDPRAQAMAARHGIDISDLRARQVTAEDFVRFDHIIAMDRQNLTNLRRIRPGDARARFSLMLDHVPGRKGEEVADPYYGGPDGFEATWDDVSAGCAALLDRIAGR